MYTFHTDPGHGWLEVERKELKELGIEQKITYFSYQNGNKVFLEEDCDAMTFIKAKWKNTAEAKKHIADKYQENTPIRNYESYFPE